MPYDIIATPPHTSEHQGAAAHTAVKNRLPPSMRRATYIHDVLVQRLCLRWCTAVSYAVLSCLRSPLPVNHETIESREPKHPRNVVPLDTCEICSPTVTQTQQTNLTGKTHTHYHGDVVGVFLFFFFFLTLSSFFSPLWQAGAGSMIELMKFDMGGSACTLGAAKV